MKYTEKYGKGYDSTNLKRFRKFYLIFSKSAPLGHQLSWSHFRELLPIKEENKRNFYINLCIEKNLSKRDLIYEIKSNSYERLINKNEKIEIISNIKTFPLANMQNPIIIKLNKNENISTEHDLEIKLLS